MTTTVVAPLDPPSDCPPRWRRFLAIVMLRDVPFWQNTFSRRVARVFAFGGYSYVGVFLVLLALENQLLFPGSTAAREWYEPAPELAIQEVKLASADGNTIHAWWSVPDGWTPERGAILYSHGNGGNLSMRQMNILHWRDATKQAVLIYDYPGYGKSTGMPTEAGCYAAADAAYDWLIDKQQIAASQLLLVGSSLGGAMAVDLAGAARVSNLGAGKRLHLLPQHGPEDLPLVSSAMAGQQSTGQPAQDRQVRCPDLHDARHGRHADSVLPGRAAVCGGKGTEAFLAPARRWPLASERKVLL